MILTVTLNPAVDFTLHVDGLSPHDRNRVTKVEQDAGGKGINLSRVAAELGAATTATGFLGGLTGAYVRDVMRREGVTDACVQVALPTRTVWSVESGDGPPTSFHGRGEPVSGPEWDALVQAVSGLAAEAEWVAFGGSLPEGVPPDAYLTLGRLARQAGAKVLVDADGAAMKSAMGLPPDLVKPNRAEAARLLGRPLATLDEVESAAREIRDSLAPDGTAIVSLGRDGAVLATREGTRRFPAVPVQQVSTIGCGDSMLAGFLVGLGRYGDPASAIKLAMAAGAATAETGGTGIASRHRTEELLASLG